MTLDTLTLALAGVVAFLTILWRITKRGPRLPPGPPCYPLVGSLLSINFADFVEEMRKMRTLYGDVFSIMISYKPVIVVCGFKANHDILVKHGDVCSDRPSDNYLIAVDLKHRGIFASNGQLWKEHGTFTLSALRSFGVGRRSIESRIAEEIVNVLDILKKKDGETFRINDIIPVGIANVICNVLFGQRFEYTDKRLMTLLVMMDDIFTLGSFGSGLVSYFPWMRFLPGIRAWSKEYLGLKKKLLDYIEGIVNEHKSTFSENILRDYIDVYLSEQKNKENDPNSTFTDVQLVQTVIDFFTAGVETTSTTIQWACVFLLEYHEVQERMRKEIFEVAGTNRRPTLSDKLSLPYCEAVISEVQRYANVLPILGLRVTTQNIQWNGYTIPKGATIINNIDTVLYDPEVFPEPMEFKPERFLTDDGKYTGTKDSMMAFGAGRRKCIGESLATSELFLFITAIVQKFELRPEKDNIMPEIEFTYGFTRVLKPFFMRAIPVQY